MQLRPNSTLVAYCDCHRDCGIPRFRDEFLLYAFHRSDLNWANKKLSVKDIALKLLSEQHTMDETNMVFYNCMEIQRMRCISMQ